MSDETPNYRESENGLPPELRPLFRRLVDEYKFIAHLRYGRGWVAYKVLADLIRAGWRPSDTPTDDSPLK